MRAPLVISGRQVHRPPPAGTLDGCVHPRAECILTRFPLGRGRLVSLSRPWNFHSPRSLPRTNHSPSECEQRFAQFIIDLHADSSYIIRPRFLGLERSQRHQENEDGCCWDGVLYGGAFNRNSILSCGVLLDLVARCSSVVMNAMLVLCYIVLRYCFQSIGSNVGDTLEFVRIFKFFDLI